jgi:hypothetical protein
MRVCCVDGPCQGLMYIDVDTGRVLFGDVPDTDGCIARISADETIDTLAGRYPAAYFDHVDWPVSLGHTQGH